MQCGSTWAERNSSVQKVRQCCLHRLDRVAPCCRELFLTCWQAMQLSCGHGVRHAITIRFANVQSGIRMMSWNSWRSPPYETALHTQRSAISVKQQMFSRFERACEPCTRMSAQQTGLQLPLSRCQSGVQSVTENYSATGGCADGGAGGPWRQRGPGRCCGRPVVSGARGRRVVGA